MFKLEYGLGYTEDVIEETDDMDGLARQSADSFQEAAEIKSRRMSLAAFRRFIIRTVDIFWIIRLHCPLFLKI